MAKKKHGGIKEILRTGRAPAGHSWTPFMHEHLGHEPVEITGPRQFDRELKKRGLVCLGDEGRVGDKPGKSRTIYSFPTKKPRK